MTRHHGKKLLLDLFSGGGGSAVGYTRAGFDVVGVDNNPKPLRHYPFPHLCADALETMTTLLNGGCFMASNGREYRLSDFAAIHASPPCQGVSIMRNLRWLAAREYVVLIRPVRDLLDKTGLLYVIENVSSARWGSSVLARFGNAEHGMKAGYLCGGMFGLPVYRHRLFETNWFWMQPAHPKHRGHIRVGRMLGSRASDIVIASKHTLTTSPPQLAVGHAARGGISPMDALGVPWMNRADATQAIPPAYTEYIGTALLKILLKEEKS